MTELEKFMQSLNPETLKKLKNFTQSDEGSKLIKSLSGESKENLVKKISQMSESDKNALLKKAMQNPTVLSKLKGLL